MRSTVLLTTLLVLAGGALLLSSSALAAIDLGAGDNSPVVAYEPATQTTYVAWDENEHGSVELCVLPPTATACLGGAPYRMKDAKAESGIPSYNGYGAPQLVLEPEGGVVLVADLDPVSAAATPSGWSGRAGARRWR
jgi:hypothetical protein